MSPSGIIIGNKVTGALLAELIEGQVRPIRAYDVLGGEKTLAIGVPGAFTPVCTDQHVPALIRNAERLRRSGYDSLVCIVASDPFVTDAWARLVDPKRWIRFVSDGNLSFAKSLGLVTHEQSLFLGDRSERYMLTLRKGVIETIRVEKHLADYACTQPDDFVVDAA